MDLIKFFLNQFDTITLEEMDSVKLMNRTDTKFAISKVDLLHILPHLQDCYRVLQANNKLISNYHTRYFDTIEKRFYRWHHNGKSNRFKIRMRTYLDSDLIFLEIKNKINLRTDKKRIRLKNHAWNSACNDFTHPILQYGEKLEPTLDNNFSRITLVGKNIEERLTIDLNISFFEFQKTAGHLLDDLVICELKQAKLNRESPFYRLVKSKSIRPSSISKYCLGLQIIEPCIKANKFKAKQHPFNNLLKTNLCNSYLQFSHV